MFTDSCYPSFDLMLILESAPNKAVYSEYESLVESRGFAIINEERFLFDLEMAYQSNDVILHTETHYFK